jgi:hypothetical protein
LLPLRKVLYTLSRRTFRVQTPTFVNKAGRIRRTHATVRHRRSR